MQGLIAPASVEFFYKEGQLLGNKASLERHICKGTGNPPSALRGNPLSDFSIAERMSWAVKRETTYEEDQAYCLFGIFDIHLGQIYGEGLTHAFRRFWKELPALGGKLSIHSESDHLLFKQT